MNTSAVKHEIAPTLFKRQQNPLLQPFLKWAGGKRQLLPQIREYIPKTYKRYFESFVGAGAVFFDEQPKTAFINDVNKELTNCYRIIKEMPDELIKHVKTHSNTEEYFYKLRGLDREHEFADLSQLERASRIIFLNKTCFNGLFRVNSQGQFNVPFGNYRNPLIVDDVVIRAISNYLNEKDITITDEDFEVNLERAKKGDFVYLDPPYDPISDTSSFTGYSLDSFDRDEQTRLKNVCDKLSKKGCKVLLSNSATQFIRELYADTDTYTIVEVQASRNINSNGMRRGKIDELLIFNNYVV